MLMYYPSYISSKQTMPQLNHYHVLFNLLDHGSFKPDTYLDSPQLLATFLRGLDYTVEYLEKNSGSEHDSTFNEEKYVTNIAVLKQLRAVFVDILIPQHMTEPQLNQSGSYVLKLCAHSETKLNSSAVHILRFIIQIYAFRYFQRQKHNIKVDISTLINQFNKFSKDEETVTKAMFVFDSFELKINNLVTLTLNTKSHFTTFFKEFLYGEHQDVIRNLLIPVEILEEGSDVLKTLLSLKPQSQNEGYVSPIGVDESINAIDIATDNAKVHKRSVSPVNLYEYSKSKQEMLLMPNLSYGIFDYELRSIEAQLLNDLKQGVTIAVIVYLALVLSKKQKEIQNLIVSDVDSDHTDIYVSANGVYWCRHDVKMPHQSSVGLENLSATVLNPYEKKVNLRLSDTLLSLLQVNQSSKLSSLIKYTKQEMDDYLVKVRKLCNLRRPLSFKSLRFAYFSRLAYQIDPSFSAFIFASTSFTKPTSHYYLSCTHERVQTAFYDVTSALTQPEPNSNSEIFAGVPKTFNSEWVKCVFTSLYHQLEDFCGYQEATTEQLILHHNKFVAYILLAFHLACGLREAKHIVIDDITLDLEMGLLYVSDKNVDAIHVSRIIPVPKLLIKQIDFFQRHLVWMAKKLSQTHYEIASVLFALAKKQRLNYAKFSFIINAKLFMPCSQLVFEFSDIQKGIPRNAFRHYLASNLPLSIESYRQYILGHIVSGAHIYSTYNLVPISGIDELKNELENLLVSSGYRCFEVVFNKGKLPRFESYLLKTWVPEKWIQRIEIRSKAFKVLRDNFDF